MQRSCVLEKPFLQIWLPSGAEKAVTMAVRYSSRLMFALFLLIHRSHNTAGDGRTREWLFEVANSPLDTGHTTRCKTLSISCDRLLRACDCSLLLSVVGSKWRIHLLSTLICLLCDVSSACSCHGGSDTSENPWMVFRLIGSPSVWKLLWMRDFPTSRHRPLDAGAPEHRPDHYRPDPVASRTTSRGC